MSRPQSRGDFPYWLVVLAGIGAWLYWQVLSNDLYAEVLTKLSAGIRITVLVTVVAFSAASTIGLLLAVMTRSRHIVIRQIARFYIEVMRGVPIVVLLLYVAFVFAPAVVAGWNWIAEATGLPAVRPRDFSLLWRAVLALTLAYSAFIAEVFRAGLQSVETGQIEAAEALGLSRWHTFRLIVFPQAFRTILPPLGNDFVAMVKDSSLVAILGVTDITQMGKLIAAGNFRYFETYNVVALIYLTITVTLSLLLRRLEMRLRHKGER